MVVLEMPPLKPEKAFSVPDGYFSDLIYDLDVAPKVFKYFPEAKFYDARDDVHESRFAVVLPESERDNFFIQLILMKEAMESISFQLTMRSGDEKGEIRRWLDEAAKHVKLVMVEDEWQPCILRKRYERFGKEFADVEDPNGNMHGPCLVSAMKEYDWKKDND